MANASPVTITNENRWPLMVGERIKIPAADVPPGKRGTPGRVQIERALYDAHRAVLDGLAKVGAVSLIGV